MRANLTIAAILTISAVTLTACGEGGDDTCMNCPGPVSTAFEGIIAGNDGVENGTLSLSLSDDGTGSGSFRIGGNTVNLTSVSTTGNTMTASGGGYTFTGTVSGIFIDGTYTGGAGGLLAAAEDDGVVTLIPYCAAHDNGGGVAGVFAFIYNASTNAIRGAWTTGGGSAFKGILSGFSGDDSGVMSGHTGTVTVLPNVGNLTVSGFFDLDSGEAGDISGAACT
jgi:hypothetical protein